MLHCTANTMKKLIITFLLLLCAFFGIWMAKQQTPINRPADIMEAPQNNLPWWDSDNVPKPEPEWVLDPEIPANYIPVPGKDNLFMVIDDDGNVTEYRKREKQEEGSWLWSTVDPNIPENYESTDIKDVYKTTDENGTESYFKYIRNKDGSFAFVPVDESGNLLEENHEKNEEIPENYIRITGNIYGVYNEHGVCIGYKERCYDKQESRYFWKDAEEPVLPEKPKPKPDPASKPKPKPNPVPDSNTNTNNEKPTSPPAENTHQNNDGTYTVTETSRKTSFENGWAITYETKIVKTFNPNGTLVSTKKEGPYEVSREQYDDTDIPNHVNPSLIAGTLKEEYARVSVGVNFQSERAQKLAQELNQSRIAAQQAPLMPVSGSDISLLSAIRAVDMANFKSADLTSPLYGSINDTADRFGIQYGDLTEIRWRCIASDDIRKTASAILLMCDKFDKTPYTDIGISIVDRGAYQYISVVLIVAP